jgi:hypothetical protein
MLQLTVPQIVNYLRLETACPPRTIAPPFCARRYGSAAVPAHHAQRGIDGGRAGFLASVESALADIGKAAEGLTAESGEVTGLLRINAPRGEF